MPFRKRPDCRFYSIVEGSVIWSEKYVGGVMCLGGMGALMKKETAVSIVTGIGMNGFYCGREWIYGLSN